MTPLLVVAVLLPPAVANEPATPNKMVGGEPAAVVAYRHQAFQGMGKHMKVLSMAAKNKVSLPVGDRVLHARALAAVAPVIEGWFPAGTETGAAPGSEALSEIWTNTSGFQDAIGTFRGATEALVAAAEGGDPAALLPALQQVGASCGGCHDTFRKDDED